MKLTRILKHLVTGSWHAKQLFPKATMNQIEHAIHQAERGHRGEICFVVLPALSWLETARGVSPRERAMRAFSDLMVWDTEENTGVLVFLLLADRDLEIIADRGIHSRVNEAVWQQICHQVENKFKLGEFEAGVLLAIEKIGAVLATHFPAQKEARQRAGNQLSDKPTIL